MKFMAPTSIVNMNIKNNTPQGLKSRFLRPLVSTLPSGLLWTFFMHRH